MFRRMASMGELLNWCLRCIDGISRMDSLLSLCHRTVANRVERMSGNQVVSFNTKLCHSTRKLNESFILSIRAPVVLTELHIT